MNLHQIWLWIEQYNRDEPIYRKIFDPLFGIITAFTGAWYEIVKDFIKWIEEG